LIALHLGFRSQGLRLLGLPSDMSDRRAGPADVAYPLGHSDEVKKYIEKGDRNHGDAT